MSFFKKIGRGFKNAFESIGDATDKVVDGVSDIAEKVVDIAGDVTEGVTRVVAGDKAADKVKNSFDTMIEPAVKRTVKGIASVIATPLAALDDMAQKGLIDGITSHTIEGTQDILGGATRLVAGEKIEKKFDEMFDKKIQSYAEMATGIAARIALCAIPGGQLVLFADAGSEMASLGYRVANDETLGIMDYVGAGSSFIGIGAGGVAIKNMATSMVNTTAKSTLSKTQNIADDITKSAVQASDDVALQATNLSVKEIAKDTALESTEAIATDEAIALAMKKYQEFNAKNTTTSSLDDAHGGYGMPVANSGNNTFYPLCV
jgi:hypothetical protein